MVVRRKKEHRMGRGTAPLKKNACNTGDNDRSPPEHRCQVAVVPIIKAMAGVACLVTESLFILDNQSIVNHVPFPGTAFGRSLSPPANKIDRLTSSCPEFLFYQFTKRGDLF